MYSERVPSCPQAVTSAGQLRFPLGHRGAQLLDGLLRRVPAAGRERDEQERCH